MAHLSSKFVLKRARALRKVQESVKRKWAWDEKSLADWDAAIQGVEDEQAVEAKSKAALNGAHSRFISEYRDLRARTLQELGMLKNRHRNDSIKLARLAALRARGGDHQSILDEALALQGVWKELEQDGSSTQENPLSSFSTLLLRCIHAHNAEATAEIKWKADCESLNQKTRNLEFATAAWYADATLIFAKGTVEGNMIRSTISAATYPKDALPASKVIVTSARA
jgi:hypothetical protein